MRWIDRILVPVLVVGLVVWFYFWKGEGMLERLAKAITDFEGKPGDKNYRNNNPGNLRPPGGKSTFWAGQTGVDPKGGYAVFESWEAGWNALLGDLKIKIRRHPEWTVGDLFAVWLGGKPGATVNNGEGNSASYASYIAKRIGVGISTTLGSLFGKAV
jgi:hypothetical protein